MKYRRIHIVLVVLGIALWGAPTCVDPDPWENVQVQPDGETISDVQTVLQIREEIIGSIEKEFEATSLDKENLCAFEERAKEKLLDLADYINIYSNKKYYDSFRDQAKKMMLNLFKDDVNTKIDLLDSHEERKYNLHEFLTEINQIKYDNIKLDVSHVRISDSLKLSENGNYTGDITLSKEINSLTARDTLLISSGMNKVEIIVSRSVKKFGNDSLKIWNAQLGDIQ